MIVPFVKTQTIGNDFVLVREIDLGGLSPEYFAQFTADRRFSIGHDGLIVVAPESGSVRVRFFNPDGSEDFCGNGLRCSGLYAFTEGWVGSHFEQRQNGRTIRTQISNGIVSTIMPAAEFDPILVPVCSTVEFVDKEVFGVSGTALSTGSTHFVVMVDELPESPAFEKISRQIENASIFPQKTTVMWTKVLNDREIKVRIWERGVGETIGCGTGAIASAVVHSRKTGVTGTIRVASGGGTLGIVIDRWDLPVEVSSSPRRVFSGIIDVL